MSTGYDPDEEIRARHIVVLVPHDPRWCKQFSVEKDKIRAALGESVIDVEHVGSTAVPDLEAKPVIDIHITVHDSSDEASYLLQLIDAAYVLVHREPNWFEHRMLRGRDPRVNLHVFSQGCPEVDRCCLFRDWLCVCPEDRALYAAAKRKLARHAWQDVNDYAIAKRHIVETIMKRALIGHTNERRR
jgi:GrpB-like predicted nucleotidyltransferase (UPF0157 family)